MISGIFEHCIGSRNAEASLKYWAELGYREIQRGQLSADAAQQLYGHASELMSVRLQNGNSADHGLVRIMQWQQLHNAGLEKTLPLTVGSRWFASLVQDLYVLFDAFTDDNASGGDWIVTEPVRGIEFVGNQGSSFYQRFVGVREMFVIGAETRQAFFQRYGYTRSGYGTIDPVSPLGVSEGTHSSIVTPDHSTAAFYAEVLGLVPSEINGKRSGYQNSATRQIMLLNEGEEFYLSAFLSPQSTVGMLQIYSPIHTTADRRHLSQPGSLGLSLFTYQTDNIQDLHHRVSASDATAVTPILPNEFGEPAFGFVAPDGMCWGMNGALFA